MKSIVHTQILEIGGWGLHTILIFLVKLNVSVHAVHGNILKFTKSPYFLECILLSPIRLFAGGTVSGCLNHEAQHYVHWSSTLM